MSKRIVLFSFHYFPDQSPGSTRSKALISALIDEDTNVKIWLLCSLPRRYNQWRGMSSDSFSELLQKSNINKRVIIKRFWIPSLGNSIPSQLLSYLFYAVQALLYSLIIKPNIIIATSAKLLTSLIATISSRITGSLIYIDIRDTFSDNYFYFYRFRKRIIFQSLIMVVENIILNNAHSINFISPGFNHAFNGLERILQKKSITFTNFTNGIDQDIQKRIKSITTPKVKSNDVYRIIYAGNLGEGQDLVSLIKSISKNKNTLDELINSNIKLELYGSGSQLDEIKQLICLRSGNKSKKTINNVVSYCGLVSKDEILNIYKNADCLLLQVANFASLSMVIPSKIFEYAATPYPIIYSTAGFTSSFIAKISGTIPYDFTGSNTFLEACKKLNKVEVDLDQRNKFLTYYNSHRIYKSYASHILENI